MKAWVIAMAICALSGMGCTQVKSIEHRVTRTGWVQWATAEDFQGHGFVQSVSHTGNAVVEITFQRDMAPWSLGPGTVSVISEKQGRDVTDAFRFEYNPQNRRLTLRPEHPAFNFGTGNLVTLRVSPGIRNAHGVTMGKEFVWSFQT